MSARFIGAPPADARPLLARDHAAPEPTLALAKASSLGRGRVRPLAWCSRPRSSAALPDGALSVALVLREAARWPVRLGSVAAARAVERGDVLERNQDVAVP